MIARNPNEERTLYYSVGGEYLQWIDLDKSESITLYPDFFRTMDFENDREVKHFLSRD